MKPQVMSWDGQRPLSGVRSIFLRARWAQVDWHVLLIAVILLAIGLIFVRAMAEMDELKLRSGVVWSSHLKKVAVSLPFLLLGIVMRPRWLRNNSYALYVAAVVLLLLVPFIGEYRNNARRWIALPFGFDLQPSELAKLGLILALARALYRNRLERLIEKGPFFKFFLI